MDLENTNYTKVINKKLKKCGYCGKELKPKGFDYLYANISADDIEYERCDCNKAKEYWNMKDEIERLKQRREHYKRLIHRIYKETYMKANYQNKNFENYNARLVNRKAVEIVKDYTKKCIEGSETNGMIITGASGIGKTHLAAAIANKLVEDGKIVLMGRLTTLLDKIKETFVDSTKSENELIELYSNVEMIIIDDLGTERISKWALEKLYTIVENRNENRLPIIITTRFDKNGLLKRFREGQDEQLADAVIAKLYQMCYGVTLINEKELVYADKHKTNSTNQINYNKKIKNCKEKGMN